MSHKAGAELFASKKPWSHNKDKILTWYLTPYLMKIRKRCPRILIVDAFAGKGRFDDGQPSSPLRICEIASKAQKYGAEVTVLCIEPKRSYHDELERNISSYGFARASPHPHGLRLMNDNMAKNKGKREFAIHLLAPAELSDLLLELAQQPIDIGTLHLRLIQKHFCIYSESEINKQIGVLIERNLLRAEGNEGKISDWIIVCAK